MRSLSDIYYNIDDLLEALIKHYKNKGVILRKIIYLSLFLLLGGCSSIENNSIDNIQIFKNNKKNFTYDSCTKFSYISQNEEEKYGKLFYEYINLDSNCSWNGMSRGFFDDLFKSTLKIKNIERIEYKNYEFSTYIIDDKYYMNLIYSYSVYEDFFIIDYEGKLFDEMIRLYDKNYINKYTNEPRFNSNYSNSLVRMNILNGYFSKQGESDFGN